MNHRACNWLIGLTALIFTTATLLAQQSLSVDVRMVEVYVSVFDGKGNRVQHLQKDDFELVEEGVRQKVDVFESQAAGMDLALLIDTSGSMMLQLPHVKNAVADLLTLLGPDDKVGLFSFMNRLTALQPLTRDRSSVLSVLLNTRPTGQTALYDSLAQLARDLSKSGGKKVILMFTDGSDNASVLTIESAVANVRRIGVPVYTVAQGETLRNREVFKKLQEISQSTNGVAFESRKPDDLREIFTRIGRDIQHLYLLGYYPANADGKADWRRIGVRLPRHPEFKVRAKEGYWK